MPIASNIRWSGYRVRSNLPLVWRLRRKSLTTVFWAVLVCFISSGLSGCVDALVNSYVADKRAETRVSKETIVYVDHCEVNDDRSVVCSLLKSNACITPGSRLIGGDRQIPKCGETRKVNNSIIDNMFIHVRQGRHGRKKIKVRALGDSKIGFELPKPLDIPSRSSDAWLLTSQGSRMYLFEPYRVPVPPGLYLEDADSKYEIRKVGNYFEGDPDWPRAVEEVRAKLAELEETETRKKKAAEQKKIEEENALLKSAYVASRSIKKEFRIGSSDNTSVMKTLEVILRDPTIITIGSSIPEIGDIITIYQFDGKRLLTLGGNSALGRFRCVRNPEVVLDFPLERGKKWTTVLCGRRLDGSKVTVRREVIGEETLDLPYGKFEGAIGVKTVSLGDVNIDYYTKELGWIGNKGKDLKGKWHWTFRLSGVQEPQ